VLNFRRMLTAFRLVLLLFFLLSLGNRSCQRSQPPPCPAMPTTRRRWRWRQCAAGGVWVVRPDAARMGRRPGGVRGGAERPLGGGQLRVCSGGGWEWYTELFRAPAQARAGEVCALGKSGGRDDVVTLCLAAHCAPVLETGIETATTVLCAHPLGSPGSSRLSSEEALFCQYVTPLQRSPL